MIAQSNYVIYRDSKGIYRAVRADGVEVAVHEYADHVIQTVLNQAFLQDASSGHGPGDIYVRAGTYRLSKNFRGFRVYSYTRLTLDATALLLIPNGYSGAVFQFLSTANTDVVHAMIDGGILKEDIAQYPAKQQWTGFLFRATASGIERPKGILFSKIVNTVVLNASIGIRLVVEGEQGFINSNTFQFLRLWGHRYFIQFEILPAYRAGQQDFGIVNNLFSDLHCQSGLRTSIGLHNIAGFHNTFFEVKVWDIDVGVQGAKRANILPIAANTLIMGGLLAGEARLFEDKGIATRIVDAL